MPQFCTVPLCSERKGGHSFPKDKAVLKQWLIAIRRRNYTPTKHARVCKNHFHAVDYELPIEPNKEYAISILKPKTVPSRFPWNQQSEERREMKIKRAERALQRNEKRETAILLEKLKKEEKEWEEHFQIFEEPSQEMDIESSNKDVSVQCSLCTCEENITKTVNTLDTDIVSTVNTINSVSAENTAKSVNTENTVYTVNTVIFLEHRNNRKTTPTMGMFRIENLKEKPDVIQFYSGFDNYKHFMFVFNLFEDEFNHLTYYPSMQPAAQGKYALTPCDQFYLTLIKLRRSMCNKELSFHFGISQTLVSKYFITWINYLYCKFKDLNIWVPIEVIDENVMLQGKTNTCTVIIDATEAKIERPKNPVSQQATYSNYKSANTLKVLVGISGSGCVTFVSDAYGGSISDRELFEKCGIINLLQKGDVILGDRGFNIQDLVSHMDVTVNMPQFLTKGSNQFEAHQLRKSKKISSERINVERIIGLGKTFKILSNKLPFNLVPIGGRIVFVCFMLANFRKNIM